MILEIISCVGAIITPIIALSLRLTNRHTNQRTITFAVVSAIFSFLAINSLDHIEIRIAQKMGYEIVEYTVDGDEGEYFKSAPNYSDGQAIRAENIQVFLSLLLVILPYLTWLALQTKIIKTGENSMRFHTYLRLGLAICFLVAIAPLPEWYYRLLRISAFFILISQIHQSFIRGNVRTTLMYIIIGLLFNPVLIPILYKWTWQIIDSLAAIILLLTVVADYIQEQDVMNDSFLIRYFGNQNIDWREQQELNYMKLWNQFSESDLVPNKLSEYYGKTDALKFALKVVQDYSKIFTDSEYSKVMYKPENILPYPKQKIEEAHTYLIDEGTKYELFKPFQIGNLIGGKSSLATVLDTGDLPLPTTAIENANEALKFQKMD